MLERLPRCDRRFRCSARGECAGALVIANRLSEVVGFDATDARLAETLANHTTTALENGRLEQSLEQLRVLEGRLTFQAMHDPLTGLANRTLFRSDLQPGIEAHDGDVRAVLFIDLDDFKTVNDSFGHATGDALLIEVAQRLKSCVAELTPSPASVATSSRSCCATRTSPEATAVGHARSSIARNADHCRESSPQHSCQHRQSRLDRARA